MDRHRTVARCPDHRRRRRLGRGGAPARGFIMGYILFALVMLGVVVAAMSRINESQVDAEWVDGAMLRLKENIQNTRVQVITCSAMITTAGTGAQPDYPPAPASGLLADLECPQGSLASFKLFDGTSGVFAPEPPAGFQPYTYVNQFPGTLPTQAAAVYIETVATSQRALAAAKRLQKSYSAQELTVGSGTGGGGTLRFYIAKREVAPSP